MSYKVEIQYNPYIPRLNILLDNQPLAPYSRLIQYSDEDIWEWERRILDTLYSELRDDFYLIFTGTAEDSEIVQRICEKDKHCIGVEYRSFCLNDSLPKRMGKLNQLIKKFELTTYTRSVIEAKFIVSPLLNDLIDGLLEIDVNNLFCSVKVSVTEINECLKIDDTESVFLLVQSMQEGVSKRKLISSEKPVFILVEGDNNRLIDVGENYWSFSFTRENVFEVIFRCLTQYSLRTALRKCLKSLSNNQNISKELGLIYGTEPIINIVVSSEVEVGKSVKVSTSIEPSDSVIPKLKFEIKNTSVASCDGLFVYGQSEGECELDVYIFGCNQPFYTKQIRVFKRNRVTKLILSEDTLLLGINDKRQIGVSFYPLDADNANQISWISTDDNVVKVDPLGMVKGLQSGTAKIICTVENISAYCVCTVKPYLQKMEITSLDLDEYQKTKMNSLEELDIEYELYPSDCVDSLIKISSSNSDIVNVIGKRLFAKHPGEALITIENNTGRVKRTFTVDRKSVV